MIDLARVTAALADRYEIEGQLGAGGMGVVYRARQRGLGRAVAIKILPEPLGENAARFRAEARALAKLDHPGIVTLYEAELEGDTPYFVMQLVEGRALSDVIGGRPLEPPRVIEIGAQVAAALAHAHERGIVHRDVKPDNILVAADGTVRLADFGIARWTAGHPEGGPATAPGTVVGSPHYMAPEQLRGVVGPATDVYALGATLYEALTGRPPFAHDDVMAVLQAHLKAAPEPPSARVPGVPRALEALVLMMLEKDPARRPADGTAVAAQLERTAAPAARASGATRALSQSPAARPAPASVTRVVDRPPRSTPPWAFVAAAFALGVVLTVGAMRALAPPPPPVESASAEEPAPDTRPIAERARARLALYLPQLQEPITVNVTDSRKAQVASLKELSNDAGEMRNLLEPEDSGRPIQAIYDAPSCPQFCLNPQNLELVIPPPPPGGYRLEIALADAHPETLVYYAPPGGRARPLSAAREGALAVYRTQAELIPGRNVLTWFIVDPARRPVRVVSMSARPLGLGPDPVPDSSGPDPKLSGEAAHLLEQAKAAERAGQCSQAASWYREVLARAPAAESLHARLGEMLHRAGKLAMAVAELDTAARARPGDAWVWSDLGVTLRDMHRVREARRIALHALRLAPTRAWLWVNLARLEQDAGDRDRARDHVRFALQCEPHHAEALRELEQLNARP